MSLFVTILSLILLITCYVSIPFYDSPLLFVTAQTPCTDSNRHYVYENATQRSGMIIITSSDIEKCETILIRNINIISSASTSLIYFNTLIENKTSIIISNVHVQSSNSGVLPLILVAYFRYSVRNVSKIIVEDSSVTTVGEVRVCGVSFFAADLENVGEVIHRNNSISIGSFNTAITSTDDVYITIIYIAGVVSNIYQKFLIEGNSILTSPDGITFDRAPTAVASTVPTANLFIVFANENARNVSSFLFRSNRIDVPHASVSLLQCMTVSVRNGVTEGSREFVGDNNTLSVTGLYSASGDQKMTMIVVQFETHRFHGLSSIEARNNVLSASCRSLNASHNFSCETVDVRCIRVLSDVEVDDMLAANNSIHVSNTVVFRRISCVVVDIGDGGFSPRNNATVSWSTVHINNVSVLSPIVNQQVLSVWFISGRLENVTEGITFEDNHFLFSGDIILQRGNDVDTAAKQININMFTTSSHIRNVSKISVRRNSIHVSSNSFTRVESELQLLFRIFSAQRGIGDVPRRSTNNNNNNNHNGDTSLITFDSNEISGGKFNFSSRILCGDSQELSGSLLLRVIDIRSLNNIEATLSITNNTIHDVSVVFYDNVTQCPVLVQSFVLYSAEDFFNVSNIIVRNNVIHSVRVLASTPLADRISYYNVHQLIAPENLESKNTAVEDYFMQLDSRVRLAVDIMRVRSLSHIQGHVTIESNTIENLSMVNGELLSSTFTILDRGYAASPSSSSSLKIRSNIIRNILAVSSIQPHFIFTVQVSLNKNQRGTILSQFNTVEVSKNSVSNVTALAGEALTRFRPKVDPSTGNIIQNASNVRNGASLGIWFGYGDIEDISKFTVTNNEISDFFTSGSSDEKGISLIDLVGILKGVCSKFVVESNVIHGGRIRGSSHVRIVRVQSVKISLSSSMEESSPSCSFSRNSVLNITTTPGFAFNNNYSITSSSSSSPSNNNNLLYWSDYFYVSLFMFLHSIEINGTGAETLFDSNLIRSVHVVTYRADASKMFLLDIIYLRLFHQEGNVSGSSSNSSPLHCFNNSIEDSSIHLTRSTAVAAAFGLILRVSIIDIMLSVTTEENFTLKVENSRIENCTLHVLQAANDDACTGLVSMIWLPRSLNIRNSEEENTSHRRSTSSLDLLMFNTLIRNVSLNSSTVASLATLSVAGSVSGLRALDVSRNTISQCTLATTRRSDVSIISVKRDVGASVLFFDTPADLFCLSNNKITEITMVEGATSITNGMSSSTIMVSFFVFSVLRTAAGEESIKRHTPLEIFDSEISGILIMTSSSSAVSALGSITFSAVLSQETAASSGSTASSLRTLIMRGIRMHDIDFRNTSTTSKTYFRRNRVSFGLFVMNYALEKVQQLEIIDCDISILMSSSAQSWSSRTLAALAIPRLDLGNTSNNILSSSIVVHNVNVVASFKWVDTFSRTTSVVSILYLTSVRISSSTSASTDDHLMMSIINISSSSLIMDQHYQQQEQISETNNQDSSSSSSSVFGLFIVETGLFASSSTKIALVLQHNTLNVSTNKSAQPPSAISVVALVYFHKLPDRVSFLLCDGCEEGILNVINNSLLHWATPTTSVNASLVRLSSRLVTFFKVKMSQNRLQTVLTNVSTSSSTSLISLIDQQVRHGVEVIATDNVIQVLDLSNGTKFASHFIIFEPVAKNNDDNDNNLTLNATFINNSIAYVVPSSVSHSSSFVHLILSSSDESSKKCSSEIRFEKNTIVSSTSPTSSVPSIVSSSSTEIDPLDVFSSPLKANLKLTVINRNDIKTSKPDATHPTILELPQTNHLHILQTTQFVLGCKDDEETKNLWSPSTNRQFVSLRQSFVSRGYDILPLRWFCDDEERLDGNGEYYGFSHSHSPSLSHNSPSFSLSENHTLSISESSTLSKQPTRTRTKSKSKSKSKSKTKSQSKSSTIPYFEPTIRSPSSSQVALSSVAVAAGVLGAPQNAVYAMRVLTVLSLTANGCPQNKRRSDGGSSMYLFEELPFPQSLFPGFSVFEKDSTNESSLPGGFIFGSFISYAILLVLLLLQAIYVGQQQLKDLKKSPFVDKNEKKKLSIFATSPIQHRCTLFLSFTCANWVPLAGILAAASSSYSSFLAISIVICLILAIMLSAVIYDIHSIFEIKYRKNKKTRSSSSSKKHRRGVVRKNFHLLHRTVLVFPSANTSTRISKLERFSRSVLNSSIGSWLFVGDFSWECMPLKYLSTIRKMILRKQQKRNKNTSSSSSILPARYTGAVARLGDTVNGFYSPQATRGRRIPMNELHQHQLGFNSQKKKTQRRSQLRRNDDDSDSFFINDNNNNSPSSNQYYFYNRYLYYRNELSPYTTCIALSFLLIMSFLQGFALEQTEHCDIIGHINIGMNLFLSAFMLVLRPLFIPGENFVMIVMEVINVALSILLLVQPEMFSTSSEVLEIVLTVISGVTAIPVVQQCAGVLLFRFCGDSYEKEGIRKTPPKKNNSLQEQLLMNDSRNNNNFDDDDETNVDEEDDEEENDEVQEYDDQRRVQEEQEEEDFDVEEDEEEEYDHDEAEHEMEYRGPCLTTVMTHVDADENEELLLFSPKVAIDEDEHLDYDDEDGDDHLHDEADEHEDAQLMKRLLILGDDE